MRFSITKFSLRTRLLLLSAFALLALLIAVLSAYRTARTSEFYAQRQASVSVSTVLRQLSRGRDEIRDDERKRKLPPHVRDAFEKYADENQRATAIAIGLDREISAGFCTNKGEIVGSIYNQNFSAEESPYLQNACKTLDDNDSRRHEFNDSTLFVETVKLDDAPNDIIGAFAARSVGKSNIFADRFNLATQIFLLFAIIGLTGFSFLTLRDWRSGMRKIETGLQQISDDLSARIGESGIAELTQFSREINRLAENLETNLVRQSQLEKELAKNERLSALGRVASGVAHEIRNPLAAMKLKIQLAQRQNFDQEKLGKTFVVLNEEINRLDNLISRMLDAGKREQINFVEVVPTVILLERLEFIKEKASAHDVKIETCLIDKDSKIEGDEEKLTQIFDNLLNNALETMPNGGVLKVGSFNASNKIVYEFSDSGAGIPIAEKEKIFEPFYTTKEKGTGLGLAISREIVEAHDGKLFLTATETGAKFVIEFPRIKTD